MEDGKEYALQLKCLVCTLVGDSSIGLRDWNVIGLICTCYGINTTRLR